MLDEKKIFLGERRRITLDTWLVNSRPFVVTNASWKLYRRDQLVASGKLVTTQSAHHWLLQAMIEPKDLGLHELVFTYYLGDERMIRRLKINVKKS